MLGQLHCSLAYRSESMKPINLRIAEELGVREQQVAAAISLLDGGATVPFVARYRKEATGALDDAQLRTLDERLRYLRELDERRAVILDSISQQGKLDAGLKQGPWILGENFSAADIVIGSGLNFAVRLFKMIPARTSFDRYIDACTARPAFQRASAIAAG